MAFSNILSKLLAKRGIKDISELTNEEKETFDNYEKILSKEELTMEDLRHFLGVQIGLIESKWRNHDISQMQKMELIPYHTVYKTILEALNAPQVERKALEDYLNQQL